MFVFICTDLICIFEKELHTMHPTDALKHTIPRRSYCELPECGVEMEACEGTYCSKKCLRREQMNLLAPLLIAVMFVSFVGCLGLKLGVSFWAVFCFSLPVFAKKVFGS